MSEGLNIEELERSVLADLESYRYEVSHNAFGRPLSDEWVQGQLAEMRAALVKPEWRLVEMRDTPEQIHRDPPELRECVVVAEDARGDADLYYDPLEGEFVLASGDPPQTFGVRGDAVGCFMAR
ncbi:MAG: hypothetical protein M3364_03250 [Actinomycetota bacterium]|nr:hypothetical protein [Actinomycetota bacterium]